MTPLDRSRLEKALADHGFDLTTVLEGIWVVGRSTQHPFAVWLSYRGDGAIDLACSGVTLCSALIKEGYTCQPGGELPAKSEWKICAADYAAFYQALGRVAALSRSLPNQVAKRYANVTKTLPKSTEAERLVLQRIGQGLFREALIDYWQGRCAVTGLDIVPLLRASHIKPWASCDSDEERLDVFNGLLLAPHLDALFDGGWISFTDTGAMQLSPRLTAQQRVLLGLTTSWPDLGLSPEHQTYLSYHRGVLFKR